MSKQTAHLLQPGECLDQRRANSAVDRWNQVPGLANRMLQLEGDESLPWRSLVVISGSGYQNSGSDLTALNAQFINAGNPVLF